MSAAPDRAPRLEERWDIKGIDGQFRQIYVDPTSHGDVAYLLEQLRSLAGAAGQYHSHVEVKWQPAVPR